MFKIIEAKEKKHLNRVRILFREYELFLGVDLCFQNFEQELANLPGQYAPPKGCILLGTEDDRLVGCVALKPLKQDICEMKRLFVRPEFRGLGYGKKLAEEIIKKARTIGYRYMRLDTLSSLKQAMNLYQSLGFKKIKPYYFNPLPNVIFLELKLDKT
ncbi:MAG: GNAT family N-acetyltransferase [Calditrichaeota bacterium]|nr:GNAT family N-acetyltransferase [Calditrichota bacterium]